MFSMLISRIRRFVHGAWQSSPLALRLTAWYTIACFSLLASATGLLYIALSANLERDNDLFLADKVHVITALLHDRPNDSEGLHEEIELEAAARQYQPFYIRLLNEQRQAVLTTPGMDGQIHHARFAQASAGKTGRTFRIRSSKGKLFRAVVAEAPVGPPIGKTWAVEVAVDLTQEQALLRRYRLWIWILLAVSSVICPWVGYQIAHRGIRPLKNVVETARRISSATLAQRIPLDEYPVEVATLAKTFNEMLDRLEDSFARLSQFSADIAHELRTPVNNIRGETEVALARSRSVEEYREVLGSCLEESVRLSDLIGSLLFLAQTETPDAHLNVEKVDVCRLLSTVHDYFEAIATDREVALRVECAEGIWTDGDRALLQRALGNLVSNALAHTPPGGSVLLSARPASEGVQLDVADTGVGIPSEALPRVFDRFYRVDPARSPQSGGTGLGLAIVRGIVALHGGRVHIESIVGKGTTVSLLMPQIAAIPEDRAARR
jgi:two-component system heavy metal sensor histidine kinase CusS